MLAVAVPQAAAAPGGIVPAAEGRLHADRPQRRFPFERLVKGNVVPDRILPAHDAAGAEAELLIQPDRVPVFDGGVAADAVAAAAAQHLQHVVQHQAAEAGALHGGIHRQAVEDARADAAGPGQAVVLRLLPGHEHDRRGQDAALPHVEQLALLNIAADHFLIRIAAPVPVLQAFFLHIVRNMPVKSEQFVRFPLCCPDQFHAISSSDFIPGTKDLRDPSLRPG